MNRNRIVVIDGGYDSYEIERKIFERAGFSFEIYSEESDNQKLKINFARGAIGMLIRSALVDESFLRELPELKAIVRYGVGYENVDLAAATRRGVKVAIVRGYGRHAVSEHALALMFACARALPMGELSLLTHFAKPPRQPLFEFHDKTLGIIGLGSIGGMLCSKARCLFKRILATDPYISVRRFEELGAEECDLSTLLAESHVISLHCNLTDETQGLIAGQAFEQMAKRPILINTARGPVVNDDALLWALKNDMIHSAGLDVYAEEPPLRINPELLNHPHVITTGHYAWYSEEGSRELQRRAAENMLALLRGETIDDCLNP
ncbi:MAG TPA: NAD(P)-dependent oxidoreductase [bacterium]